MQEFLKRQLPALTTSVIIGVLAGGASVALASLTFSGTAITGTGAVVVDGPNTISIGTSTATAINIGNPNTTILFAGSFTAATATFSGNITVSSTVTVGGANGQINLTEGAPPTCATGTDWLWADAAHALKACVNGGAAISLGAAPSVANSSTVGTVIPRDGLVVDGSGNLDDSWATDRTLYQWDALITSVGCPNGWGTRGTGPTPTGGDASWPDIGGTISVSSASASSSYGACEFGQANSLTQLGGHAGWDSVARFKLAQTTNTRLYVGYSGWASGPRGSSGFWLRYDNNATYNDTDFVLESCLGGTCTTQDTGVPADTSFHSIRIQSLTAGQVTFTLYSATGTMQYGPFTITTLVANTPFTAVFRVGNDTTASTVSATLNKWGFRARGIGR